MIQILRLLRGAAGSDRDLLNRYVRDRDEEAFEALVRRYGAGVWAACVRLAGRDAEDAYQAVFLTLSRKAEAVTGSLPAWLHAVTRRVAATLRRAARRRNAIEATAARPDVTTCADPSLREGLSLLDEELSRLPERYRAVLIACCLEGRSRDEAAEHLGWSEGQIKGRLERAREMLRSGLSRRGFELGGLLLAASVAGPIPALAGPPSAAALSLTHGVIRAMLIQKLRLAITVLATCIGIAFAGGLVLQAQSGDPPTAEPKGVAIAPNRAGTAGPQDKGDSSLKGVDERARKEIEDLRKRVAALEKLQTLHAPEQQKIVVTSPRTKDVVVAHQYVGKILANRHINVSALASGVIAEVPVKEGQAVKNGEVLFKIGPALYQAKLDAEMAEVKIAQIEMTNTKKLFEQKVVSNLELALSEAKLARAQAKSDLAKAELSFTAVRAPFDGHIGRLQVQQGSGAVKEGDILTTLTNNNFLRVYFKVPEALYLDDMAKGKLLSEGSQVELVLANRTTFAQTGRIASIEPQFESDTGNISIWADFPNPKGLLRHGQSGNVLIRETLKNSLVIPQRATFEDDGKRYVYIVDKDDVARRREIVVSNEVDKLYVVGKGLSASDRIVLDGVRQVRDGEKVEFEFRKLDDTANNPKAPVDK